MKEEEQKDGVKTEEVPGRKDGSQRYSVEQKLRAVRLYLEEGYPLDLVQRETKVSISSLWLWVRRYRKEGEAGLRREAAPRPGRRLPAAVAEKIVGPIRKGHVSPFTSATPPSNSMCRGQSEGGELCTLHSADPGLFGNRSFFEQVADGPALRGGAVAERHCCHPGEQLPTQEKTQKSPA